MHRRPGPADSVNSGLEFPTFAEVEFPRSGVRFLGQPSLRVSELGEVARVLGAAPVSAIAQNSTVTAR